MFEFLAEAFMMGMSQLHCNDHSSKNFVFGTSLACSFYSSPAGLLGPQRVDIGYEKLKYKRVAGRRWRRQAEVNI